MRPVTALLGVAALAAGCSGSRPGTSGHDQPDGDVATLDVVGADGDGAHCTAGAVTCTRGVRASCEDDGLWHYAACPTGQVCEGDRCVDNDGLVVLVANTPLFDSSEVAMGVTTPELEATMRETLCAELPACCEAFGAALDAGGDAAGTVATKYWIRRLAQDLDGDPRLRFTLLGPPTSTAARLFPDECGERVAAEGEPCLGGDTPLMPRQGIDERWAALSLSQTSSSLVPIPAWSPEGEVVPAVDALVSAVVKSADEPDAASLLAWVDGDLADRELNAVPAGSYDMALYTYLYLVAAARPDGRACASDADCGARGYVCADGRCDDPAAACRVADIVWIESFAETIHPRRTTDECMGGGGEFDRNVWAQWLRWGVTCDKQPPCWPDSTCRSVCDFVLNQEFCDPLESVCFPDALLAFDDPDHSYFVDSCPLSRMISDFGDAFPSPYATDIAGARFAVRSHAIFVGARPLDPSLLGYAPLEEAAATAVAGEGIAVTPCMASVADQLAERSPTSMIDCDFEAAYAQLIERIRRHAREATCSPAQVGLPERSAWLIGPAPPHE